MKAGSLEARVGNENIVVPAGGTAVFPPGVVHTWWNAGEDLLEISGRATPAVDLDRYLQALFAVLNASVSGRPSIFYLAHVLWRHRHTQAVLAPPRAICKPARSVLGSLARDLMNRRCRLAHLGTIARKSARCRRTGERTRLDEVREQKVSWKP